MNTIRDWFRAAFKAPCDPLKPPDDPYRGVIRGPELVERTKWTHAQHEAKHRDDAGFPVTEWGKFDPNQLGHSYPADVFAAPVEAE